MGDLSIPMPLRVKPPLIETIRFGKSINDTLLVLYMEYKIFIKKKKKWLSVATLTAKMCQNYIKMQFTPSGISKL